MASEHTDCLDYLYEELPPEGMAEARRHLAECPECRAEMRSVRDAVKAYRQAPRPAPPPGLAERAAALAQARAMADPVESIVPAAAPDADPAASDRSGGVSEIEFARLREEILAEAPRGWRTWFYHPAWMVAASVVFVCSILVHFSPRYGSGRPEPMGVAPASAPSIRRLSPPHDDFSPRRQSLPPTAPRQQAEAAPAPAPASSPALREAEAWTSEMESAAKAKEWVPSPRTGERPLRPPTAGDAGGAGTPAMLMESPPVPAAPPPAPSAPAASAVPLRQAPAARAPMSAPPPPYSERKLSGTRGAAREPVVVDMFGKGAEPPQLIARPKPIDTVKLARDLAVLVAMQISHGELTEAWLSIGMLRKYDAEKADELTRILEAKEAELAAARAVAPAVDAAAAPAAKAEAAPAAPVAGEFAAEVADKYAPIAASPAEPEAPAALEAAAPTEPIIPIEPAAPAEPMESVEPMVLAEPAPVPEDTPPMAPPPPATEPGAPAPSAPVILDPTQPRYQPAAPKRPVFSTDPYVRGD